MDENVIASMTHDPVERELVERVCAAGQAHIFAFWNELKESEREHLLTQLRGIDFDLLRQLKQKYLDSGTDTVFRGHIEPTPYVHLPRTAAEHAEFEKANESGAEALRQGRVAAFLVAGGQGSRLGFDGPKGKFPVSPVRGKTLFQLHSEKIAAISQRYDTTIPWYIMTSETNHDETVDFFAGNGFFGLSAGNVVFFKQEMIPALAPDGKMLLAQKHSIFQNPNGHGGSLSALKKSGSLDDMKKRGIDTIFYFQVDNVLINICDPYFLGFHIEKKAEMSAKVLQKVTPEERLGVIGRIDGRFGVIEYSDLPDELTYARDDDGSLTFGAGSIAIHVFDVAFVEKENRGGLQLPWHLAHKKIPCIDSSGNMIEPETPNAYKFETFVFDALGDVGRAVFLEVRREDEFSPVKNAEGDDSPATARRDQINQFGRWLEQGRISVPRDKNGDVDGAVEISPSYALDAEACAGKLKPDMKFSPGIYLH